MNQITAYLLRAFRFVLGLLWLTTAGVAYAAITFASTGTTIVLDPTITWLSALMSTLAGTTALFIRIDKRISEAESDRDPPALDGEVAGEPGRPAPLKPLRIALFLGMHMLGSWTAGAVGFLMGRAYDWNVWYGLMFIALASFTGATFLERAAEKVLANPLTPPTPTPAKPR